MNSLAVEMSGVCTDEKCPRINPTKAEGCGAIAGRADKLANPPFRYLAGAERRVMQIFFPASAEVLFAVLESRQT